MKSFCIIGLGRFGLALAEELCETGRDVMVIDINPDVINSVGDLVTNAVVGDPTNETMLRSSGVKDYDCAVNCLSENVNDSILVTVLLKEIGVKKVVARAGSERHKKVLEKVGADIVVFPEQDMGERIAHMLCKNEVLDYFEFADGYSIVEMKLPKKWENKTIIALNIRRRFGVTVIAVRHGDGKTDVSPSPETILLPGDVVSVMGSERDIDRLTEKI